MQLVLILPLGGFHRFFSGRPRSIFWMRELPGNEKKNVAGRMSRESDCNHPILGGKRDVIPRFVYVDATEWTKKGEISFHDKVTLEQKSFSRFYIIDPLKGRSGR